MHPYYGSNPGRLPAVTLPDLYLNTIRWNSMLSKELLRQVEAPYGSLTSIPPSTEDYSLHVEYRFEEARPRLQYVYLSKDDPIMTVANNVTVNNPNSLWFAGEDAERLIASLTANIVRNKIYPWTHDWQPPWWWFKKRFIRRQTSLLLCFGLQGELTEVSHRFTHR